MKPPPAKSMRNDRWIPWLFVYFFIGLAAIQAIFITISVSTFNGMANDASHPISLGPAALREAEERERALGWTVEPAFALTGHRSGVLTVKLADSEGRAMMDAVIAAWAERRTKVTQLLPIAFDQGVGSTYSADIALPVGGRWDLRLKISWRGETIHHQFPLDLRP